MREERLLERIRSWEREPNRRERGDERRLVESILNHLQKILNTRQGNVLIADDYGVPDFTHFLHGLPDSVRELEQCIKVTIERYEPRLRDVVVQFLPQEEELLALRFQIAARLATEGRSGVFIETIVDADGRVTVTGRM